MYASERCTHNSYLLKSGLEMSLKENSKVEEKDPKVWNVIKDLVVEDMHRSFYTYFNLSFTKSRNFCFRNDVERLN